MTKKALLIGLALVLALFALPALSPAEDVAGHVPGKQYTVTADVHTNLDFAGWALTVINPFDSSDITQQFLGLQDPPLDLGQTSVTYTQPLTIGANPYWVSLWNARVVFDSDGGSSVATATVAYNYAGTSGSALGNSFPTNNTVAEPAPPTKDGYTFEGWDLNGAPYDFSKPVTASMTLTAQWKEKPAIPPAPTIYTVTFDGQGGTPDSQTATTTAGGTVALPEVSQDGSTFMEWNTEADGSGETFDANTAVNADVTVYAQWIEDEVLPESITITTNVNGTETSKDFEDGATVSDLGSASKSGYTFSGWATSANGKVLPGETPLEDGQTYFAVFAENIAAPKTTTPAALSSLAKTGDDTAIPALGVMALLIAASAALMASRRRRGLE